MSDIPFTPLPLHEMLKSLYGARTTINENPDNVTMGVAALRIAGNNPMRLGLIVMNLSANSVYIAPSNQVAATRGIWLAPNGGQASLVWDRDMELCTREWWGIATAAGSTIYVIELLSR